jgi:ADP-heptose:LPS heptosyltransferase
LRQDRIGDVLVSEPIIRNVREHLPLATIGMVLSRNNLAALPAMQHLVEHHLCYEKNLAGFISLVRSIRYGRYDAIVDLMDNPSTTSTSIMRASGIGVRIGIDKSNRSVYTHVVPLRDRSTVHIVDRLATLLLPFGIDPDKADLKLRYACTDDELAQARSRMKADSRRTLLVNVTGTDEARRLPPQRWQNLIQRLMERCPTWRIMLMSTPNDASIMHAIAQATGADALPPTPRFHDVACAVCSCDAVLTADTSIVHVAAAAGVPQVVLYVHGNPALMPWYPYHAPHVALTGRQSIGEISDTALIEAVETLFSRIAQP